LYSLIEVCIFKKLKNLKMENELFLTDKNLPFYQKMVDKYDECFAIFATAFSKIKEKVPEQVIDKIIVINHNQFQNYETRKLQELGISSFNDYKSILNLLLENRKNKGKKQKVQTEDYSSFEDTGPEAIDEFTKKTFLLCGRDEFGDKV